MPTDWRTRRNAWVDIKAVVVNGKQVAASVIDAVKTASQTLKDEIGVKTDLVGVSVAHRLGRWTPRRSWFPA
ncbi:hypothetical protein J2Z75_005029 [Rhizobium herbae]|uniref:Uncharacterized protein n=1 Tax=Rhizobium herbae TaxID=508661 RepID=A0ABS4EU97_9HYPH|nr:hypothetical protein [Rhizobium herbae]